jgi:hypothetical protein
MRRTKLLDILKILFPALMIVGALGSLIVNLIDKGEHAISIQWLGATLLYTALMMRNIK